MITRKPCACSSLIACAVDSLIGSATATIPASVPSTATNIAVLPSVRRVSALASASAVSKSISFIIAELPSATARPPTLPRTPFPVTASKSVASWRIAPCASAPSTMASASGCSEPRSSAAASERMSASVTSPRVIVSVSFGLPIVSVPVLSTIKVSTPAMRSSASASLISTPACAPRPAAVVIEIGVANPRAQGQAMISTETAAAMAKTNAGSGPKIIQSTKARIATPTTVGTKIAATRSAIP